jgi:hypothetical protein
LQCWRCVRILLATVAAPDKAAALKNGGRAFASAAGRSVAPDRSSRMTFLQ